MWSAAATPGTQGSGLQDRTHAANCFITNSGLSRSLDLEGGWLRGLLTQQAAAWGPQPPQPRDCQAASVPALPVSLAMIHVGLAQCQELQLFLEIFHTLLQVLAGDHGCRG